MEHEFIKLTIRLVDLEENGEPYEKLVYVMRDVTVGELIEASQRRWNLDRSRQHYMWLEHEARKLTRDTLITNIAFADNNQMVELGTKLPPLHPIDVNQNEFSVIGSKEIPSNLSLKHEATARQFEIQASPVVIGRFTDPKDSNYPHLKRIPIESRDFGEDATSIISRDHAIIFHHLNETTQKLDFYLLPLASEAKKKNPTFINDEQLTDGFAYLLKHGDIIKLGQLELTFNIH